MTDELDLPAPVHPGRDSRGRFVHVAGSTQRAKLIETTAKLRAELYGGKIRVRRYARVRHRDEQAGLF